MEASPVLVETPKPKCPWATIPAPEVVTLKEVMSEQLISVLVEEEKAADEKKAEPVYLDDLSGCGEEVTGDCSDDHVLAQMLQLEYDKEYNSDLKKVESLYNGISKVRISYGKYFRQPSSEALSDDSGDDSDDEELEANARAHWSRFEAAERSFQAVGRAGVSKQGNVTTTKHDPTICGRRNAGKVMEFFPCFNSGDGGKFDMRMSNRVYNSLRQFSVAENKRGKLHDKQDHATTQKALDSKTHLILFKLLSNEFLESVTGCISTGKEACVYHAWSGLPVEECSSREFAVKVYKTTLNEFRNRQVYIKNDRRFCDRFSKLNPRRIIHLWAEKEMRNLLRIKEANIPCPEVIALKKHVLVMSFIGGETQAAPKIKDVDLPFEDMTIMYEQVVEILKTLYNTCNLVHADLSEYNLLWHQDKVWVIDVGQAIETSHPGATQFLLRDCTNVVNFFDKRGVLKLPKPEELLSEVTGELM